MPLIVSAIDYGQANIIFSQFAETNNSVLLDSSQLHHHLGRYSFIAIDPFLSLSAKNHHVLLGENKLFTNPIDILAQQLSEFQLETEKGLPPFQGGVAGFFSYELAQYLENLPRADIDDCEFPDCALGFYDLVIGFDHVDKTAFVFSSGLPEKDKKQRQKRAEKRMAWLLAKLKNHAETHSNNYNKPDINANLSREQYKSAVNKTIDYILAGDIFEANITQRFQTKLPENLSPWQLYQQLRQKNPAPFSAYLNFNDTVIASASPERFLCCQNGLVETRPIKGTRKRSQDPSVDQQLGEELLQSEKDRSENVMIVDLMRNDLSKVCQENTVKTPQLCGLESFATVHHLVSVVEGRLQKDKTALDLFKACFPGGSITGAPKIRAMEIIAECEPHVRGPYCGSIGYIGFDGTMDTSISIRTFAIKNDIVTFGAGGAVVADSDADDEYEESLVKARGLISALQG